MTEWRRLNDELDAWRDAGRRASLWWRDDDACRDSPALRRLFGVARDLEVSAALAVIPAAIEPGLVDAVSTVEYLTVVQHGYAHRNHAPAGERKWELGAHRTAGVTIAELEAGVRILERGFGARFSAVLVPPWNRIDAEVIARLPDAGFHGLSCFGPRSAPCPVPGIAQCNTHVDLIAWRKDRSFVGAEAALDRLVRHLEARRTGRVDTIEPSGILTHHLDLNADAWNFLADLIVRTREHGAVDWLDVNAVFATSRGVRVTSSRST